MSQPCKCAQSGKLQSFHAFVQRWRVLVLQMGAQSRPVEEAKSEVRHRTIDSKAWFDTSRRTLVVRYPVPGYGTWIAIQRDMESDVRSESKSTARNIVSQETPMFDQGNLNSASFFCVLHVSHLREILCVLAFDTHVRCHSQPSMCHICVRSFACCLSSCTNRGFHPDNCHLAGQTLAMRWY